MSAEQRARTAVARLELVSHGGTTNWKGTPSRNADRANGPSGGLNEKLDREVDYVEFAKALRGCRTNESFARLAEEAERALWAWTHQPPQDAPAWADVDARNQYLMEHPDVPLRTLAKVLGVSHVMILKQRRALGVA
jgi:hypothetical protein